MSLLNKLPLPPKGKKGWPWTEESPVLPSLMPNGNPWPKISIVTPSFNQGQFIEETIRSVLLQNYPNLEYVIIDGGSTDDSVEIIKKYEPWLTYWVSEKDKGQSHAIEKGFAQCTGDIYNWLCSDDIFLQNTFYILVNKTKLDIPFWLIGNAYMLDEVAQKTSKLGVIKSFSLENFLCWGSLAIHQPSVFWNKKLHKTAFHLDKNIDYCMDIDLWLKFYLITTPDIITEYLSKSRHHLNAKTTNYSKTYKTYILEYTQWKIKNIYKSNTEKITNELESVTLKMHNEINSWNRIKNHIVLGKVIKLWKHLINRNLLA